MEGERTIMREKSYYKRFKFLCYVIFGIFIGLFIVDNTVYAEPEGVVINEENFPDETFRNYIKENIERVNGIS